MGSTNWSDKHYTDRAAFRAATGTPTFAFHADAMAKPASARTAHNKMDPKGVKFRESRDSASHPESRAVAVLLDVTGSMADVPRIVQANLPKLMGILLRKALDHPQILIGAIGDVTCDRVPLQIGQFESGIEIEEDLQKLYLEGGGGGQKTESYELAMYFMAKHTALDCLEKRKQRGYLFFIGDEMPYPKVKKNEVASIIGDNLQEDVRTEDMVQELEKSFDTYYILPKMTSYYDDPEVHKHWVGLLGQNTLRLEQPDGICELIASTIALAEGKIGIDSLPDDLKEVGTDVAIATAVTNALVPYAAGKGSSVAIAESSTAGGVTKL